MTDTFDLQRFLDAQNPIFERVRSELGNGHKETHWMWFVFPQIRGLGQSSTAERYAISGHAEAEAYIRDPVLGPRLVECTKLVNAHQDKTAENILGFTDEMKFRSCMTLFAHVAPEFTCFRTALGMFFAGNSDALTLDLLSKSP